MKPETTPLEEENHHPNNHFLGSMLIFAGVTGGLFERHNGIIRMIR